MTIKWGILGTGYIANNFASDLLKRPNTELVAVGSRSLNSAKIFANHYDNLEKR